MMIMRPRRFRAPRPAKSFRILSLARRFFPAPPRRVKHVCNASCDFRYDTWNISHLVYFVQTYACGIIKDCAPSLCSRIFVIFPARRFCARTFHKRSLRNNERDDHRFYPVAAGFQIPLGFPSFAEIEIAAYQIALRWPHLLFLVLFLVLVQSDSGATTTVRFDSHWTRRRRWRRPGIPIP